MEREAHPGRTPRAAAAPARAHERRSDALAEELHRSILDGAFEADGKLPSERRLMERHGVSRSTVREALLSLRKSGLIVIRNGAVARVARPDPQHLAEQFSGLASVLLARPEGMKAFQEARRLVETALARHAALHAGPEQVAALRAALDANRAAIGRQRRFIQTDIDLHRAIAAVPGNPLLLAADQAFRDWLQEQRQITRLAGAQQEAVFAEHERIVNAIAAGDAAAAQDAMEAHLLNVERTFWKA
jgi:GntR family transcriptional regulator, sialic acid-inducible nan operon repressor